MSLRRASVRYSLAAAICAATALAALPLRGRFDLANIVMLFLLAVFVVAVRLGRGPAVLAAFLGVALFDLLFVPPHLSFTVVDAQYLLTFAVMLAVGLIASHLAARLAEQTEESRARERETRMLYELARDLGAALGVEQAAATLGDFLRALAMEHRLLIETDNGFAGFGPLALDGARDALARAAYRENTVVETGTTVCLPFAGTTRVRGVLVARPVSPTTRPLLDAVASLAGTAIERLHYAEVAQKSELDMRGEQLRSSLLSAISHDLRTPLAVLVGLAESMALTQPPPTAAQAKIAAALREGARRMSAQVDNLLDMARLQAGKVRLNRQWQPLEEVVGAALQAAAAALAGHTVDVRLPEDLPLLEIDAVLVERVLCNLLENAAKYTPSGTRVGIGAAARDQEVEIWVEDDGPGLPKGREETLFQKFERGERESATPGVGLGLAICRAIVAAHGGTIRAEKRPAGGARFVFALPRGTPPDIVENPPSGEEESTP